jgi:hypothetical protein
MPESNGDPLPSDATPRRAKPVVCEFCECRLTANGEVLSMSDRAKKLRDAEDDLRSVSEEAATLGARVKELEAKIAAAAAPPADAPPPKKRELFS